MKKIILLVSFLLSILSSFSQTVEELSMISYINKIRRDPKSFIPYIDTFIMNQEVEIDFNKKRNITIVSSKNWITPEQKIEKAKKLINELKNIEPLDTLSFSKELYSLSKLRMDSIKKSGVLSHSGFEEVVKIKLKGYTYIKENLSCKDFKKGFNNNSNYSVLISLMLDLKSTDPNFKEHRETILDKNLTKISIVIDEKWVVQNFSK